MGACWPKCATDDWGDYDPNELPKQTPCCSRPTYLLHCFSKRAGVQSYASDVVRLNLSAREVRHARRIWDDLKKVNDQKVARRLFLLIFEKCPEIKEAFNVGHLNNEEALKDPRMIHHFMIFQDTLEMILNGLCSENDYLNSLLIAFGSQHSYYTRRKFDHAYWRVFGESLMQLLDDLPTHSYPTVALFLKSRTRRLWFKCMYFIIASMRTGYRIGAAHKSVSTGKRRWWEDIRWKRKTNLESKLLEVLFVADPLEPAD